MREVIKVHVLRKPGRKILSMRYVDPLTGKQITRSARTTKQRDAERTAGVWQEDLREGRYKSPSKVTWAEFRSTYESEVLPGLSDGSFSKALPVFASIERLTPVDRLSQLTAERLSLWQKRFRDEGKAEASLRSYSATHLAALNWAKSTGRLHVVPALSMPKRAKGAKAMKGRPITAEEFERMLSKVAAVVGEERDESWKWLLRGLWWSGLRLGEALAPTWDGSGMAVDLEGRRPMAPHPRRMSQSGTRCHAPHRPRVLGDAPERARRAEDRGECVSPVKRPGEGTPRNVGDVGRTISAIGVKAGLKVSDNQGPKYASAHDLRRAFGNRWSRRIMPADLQLLMRHESIETTMKFYVGQNADETADRLYRAIGDTSGDTPTVPASAPKKETTDTQ